MVVLDLRGLTFIDTSGLRVVVLAQSRQPGRLAVVKGSRTVQRAFEICGLVKLLPFVEACPGRHLAIPPPAAETSGRWSSRRSTHGAA
jgi:hypothetical protein